MGTIKWSVGNMIDTTAHNNRDLYQYHVYNLIILHKLKMVLGTVKRQTMLLYA